MKIIRVTMKETVIYEFDIEVEDDFEADIDSVAQLAEETFVQMDSPPVTGVEDRDLVDWEEIA